ncbi:MAG: RnfABCDGE type electron transport complex subunit D [Candidatus Omnitrophota bacterium]
MKDKLIVSGSPHIYTRESVSRIMWTVVVSLIPAGIAGVIIFGWDALWITLAAVGAAVSTELIFELAAGKKITVLDGSAVITGILLAFNLPAGVPLWLPVIGAVVSMVVGKLLFGGLGQNIFNPALVGRVFLMASWPKYMTTFTRPFCDTVASATPLAALKEGKVLEHIPYWDLFIGNHGGCIGEVCILALLIGAAILFIKGYISWQIPVTYIVTTGLFMYVFGGNGFFKGDWLFHILSGGLILGAFFMATDYVATPLTAKGQIIFGVGCGVLTAVIRIWGGYPEGVSYAILMMNAATPFIDRYTKNRIYGS